MVKCSISYTLNQNKNRALIVKHTVIAHILKLTSQLATTKLKTYFKKLISIKVQQHPNLHQTCTPSLSSTVHTALPQFAALSSSCILFRTETHSIWLLCSRFYSLFPKFSSTHFCIIQLWFPHCSAHPASEPVFHLSK